MSAIATAPQEHPPLDDELAQLASASFDDAVPAVLQLVERRYGARASFACSFGVEDMVLLDQLAQHAPSVRVFTLDTGRLHEETYALMERARHKYGLALEVYTPAHEALEQLVRRDGLLSFRRSVEDRRACCGVRKVEPLKRALAGQLAWLTGMRREQSVTRAELPVVAWDDAHALWKFSPLSAWTREQTWDAARARKVPVNALHDAGYASIGCAPCTRPIQIGEDERAGRWWWESPEHKECGLHQHGRQSGARAVVAGGGQP